MTKKALLFIIINFIFSFLLIGIFKILGGNFRDKYALFILILYMFCPMFSVLVIEKLIYKGNIKNDCGVNFNFNIWFLLAWILPLVISFATIPISLLFPNIEISYFLEGFFERIKPYLTEQQFGQIKRQFDTVSFSFISFLIFQSLIAATTLNALVAFGEEIGWRGFLFNELNKNFNFWQTSFIIGFFWGLWHLPLIIQGYNYPTNPTLGVLWMIFFCILYSPIFNLIRVKSNSTVACSILHGGINATYTFSILFLKGGNEFIIGSFGVSGFVILLILNLIVYLNKNQLCIQ